MAATRKELFLGAAPLVLLTVLVYLPSLSAGFIWDDDVMLTGNPLIKAGHGLYYIWFSSRLPDYFPLTSTSFWLEWRLWGMHPFGYHLTNVLLHAFNAVLLWRVLGRLRLAGAWLAAAVWAVHPVCVASAGWISERKNTLAFFFGALSVLSYLRYVRGAGNDQRGPTAGNQPDATPERGWPQPQQPRASVPGESTRQVRRGGPAAAEDSRAPAAPQLLTLNPQPAWYWLSLLAFFLALLSKTSVVMLPFVLLLCCWWLEGTLSRPQVVGVLPFFALALVLGLVTVWFQSERGLAEGIRASSDTRLVRVLGGARAVWFYLWKAVAPFDLMMIYPRWQFSANSFSGWLPGLGLALLAGLFWWRRSSWGRPCLFAFGYVGLMLAPVSGFFEMGFLAYSQVADHWQYLSLAGVAALVVGTAGRLWPSRAQPSDRWLWVAPSVAAALLLAGLSCLSWRHQGAFANVEALWRDTLARNPAAWVAHDSLGTVLEGQGKPEAALVEYTEALRLNPQDPASHYNLANALAKQGKLPEAVTHYQESIRLCPGNAGAHHNLANAMNLQGNYAEAVTQCTEALELTPEDANIEDTLGSALVGQENWAEAGRHFAAALELNPEHAPAHDHLGRVLARRGDYPAAGLHFQTALRLKPDYGEAALDLGKTLSLMGQFQPAAESYAAALRLQPTLAEAHYDWALLCLKQAQPGQAVGHYRAALALKADYADALNNLAWLLATSPEPSLRDGPEAVRLAERACDLTQRKQARFLGTLDAAYAQAGRFAEATRLARQTRELAITAGETPLAEAAARRLELYQTNQPFHEPR